MKIQLGSLSLLAFGLVALLGLIVLAGTHNLTDPTVKDTLTAITLASLTAATGVHVATGVAGAVAANVTAPTVVDDPAGATLAAGDVAPSDPSPIGNVLP